MKGREEEFRGDAEILNDRLSISPLPVRLDAGERRQDILEEPSMQYLLLIYSSEAAEAAIPQAEMNGMLAEFGAFTQSIVASGAHKGGNRLRPVSDATTVRVRDGKTLITDGPFAETREALGGYYLIEAKDLDEATAIAARIPGARHGSIEVRPIWEM
jgi:hypothetical protein